MRANNIIFIKLITLSRNFYRDLKYYMEKTKELLQIHKFENPHEKHPLTFGLHIFLRKHIEIFDENVSGYIM